jgi:hypothetical protein
MTITLDEIVGKTIARIEWREVDGPHGAEPCCVLIFTDGTEHGFVVPADD